MSDPQCPNREQLGDYISGQLAVDSHDLIEKHIDDCDDCQVTVAQLDSQSDTFLSGLGEASVSASDPDPDLLALVQRAKEIRPADAPSVAESTTSAGPAVGTSLGNYVLQQRIGVGGMGQVYRAVHRRMKRQVAVKILSPEIVASPVARQRFQREVEAVAKLSHPNIVVAHDAGQSDGHDFLVMEYVAGRNLEEIVKQDGPLSIGTALEYVRQAACGLQYAHTAGVVHRDIKPANLLLSDSGHVKVLDLGLARSAFASISDSADLTSSGVMMGTAGYLAPEQALNPKTADHRADIYGLGCTLFFLLTGKPVYRGDTAMEIAIAHREQPIPSLSAEREDCPLWVEQVFRSMVGKQPDERPRSMAEVVERIARGLQDKPPTVAKSESVLRSRRLQIALFAVAALAVAYLAGVLDRLPGDDPPVPPIIGALSDPAALGSNIEMVNLPAGEFWMGSSAEDTMGRADERPRHRVRLTRGFQLGKFEITRDEWFQVMETPAPEVRGVGQGEDAVPVAGISWLEAIRFCNRLSERRGLRPYYVIAGETVTVRGGDGFRLPTEAEWEYACRGGSEARWHFGDDPGELSSFSWHAGNSKGTIESVGQLQANPFGLHDMLGNVPEWCWDRYDADYYANSEPVDPTGSTQGGSRVFRGGGVRDNASQIRSAARRQLAKFYGFVNAVGLRVARDVH